MKKLSVKKLFENPYVFFVILISVFMLGAGINAAADTLVKTLTLPDAHAYEYYEAKIDMQNESENYTFELDRSGILPAGLSVSPDGTISGTPTTSGTYYAVKIRITDSSGTRVTKRFKLRIKARDIRIKVSVPEGPIVYDAQPHDATIECYDLDGQLIEGLTPKVTYGAHRTEHAIDAGSHLINISNPSGCNIVNNNVTRTIIIERAQVNTLSAEGYTVDYDGQPHGITEENVTVDPQEAGFIAEYKKNGSSDYTTDVPVAAGTYDVMVYTSNENYISTMVHTTITILGDQVDFTVTNASVPYDGSGHEPTITPSKAGTGFSVTYTDEEGKTVEGKPVNAGKYKINITLANPDANTIGTISTDTFEITPKTVEFSLEQSDYIYSGTPHTPTVITNPAIPSNLYTVKYVKEGSEDKLDSVTDQGTYNVEITFTDSKNYKIANSESLTVSVKKEIGFTVTDNTKEYSGSTQKATVTPDIEGLGFVEGTDFKVTYTDGEGSEVEPTDVGTYTIAVELLSTDKTADYVMGTVSGNTFEITQKSVAFSLEENSFEYNGEAHTPVVVTNPEIESNLYTVKYVKEGETDKLDSVTEKGTYNVEITLTDSKNYKISNTDPLTVSVVNPKTAVNFTVTNNQYVYDGTARTATITPSIEGVEFTEKYVAQNGDETSTATNAGTYTIKIELTNTDDYKVGEITPNTLVIYEAGTQIVNFTVTENSKEYNKSSQKATVTPSVELTEGTDFTVTYTDGEGNEIAEPTDVGTYTIAVELLNTANTANCVKGTVSGNTFEITQKSVAFSLEENSFEYNGEAHTPVVVTNPEIESNLYTVKYVKEGETDKLDSVTEKGTYNVEITLTDSKNYKISNTDPLIVSVVNPKTAVNFTVTNNQYVYDGTEHTATITPSIEGVEFTEKYVAQNGDETSSATNAGTYTIKIELTNTEDYKVGEITPNTLVIYEAGTQIVNFTVTDNTKEYSGSAQKATVTPVIEGVELTEGTDFTVKYTDSEGGEVAEPINVGTYKISIEFITEGYAVGTLSADTLVIKEKPVTVDFVVTNNVIDYDGAGHKATLTPNVEIPDDAYTVQYRDKNGVLTDEAVNKGEYEIVVTITDDKYVLSESFTGDMVILGTMRMNTGNSPAAKLYECRNNEGWSEQMMNNFKHYHKFTDIVPEGCDSSIVYNPFGDMDLDSSIYTVIVKNIADFEDPGASANGTAIKGSEPEAVEGNNNLYKVTYTYEDESLERYVMVIGRIGDTSGDGNVNAIDANYLDRLNKKAQTVDEARVWDVNKDGNLDRSDATAIRRRFSEKLTPYYPWIETK